MSVKITGMQRMMQEIEQRVGREVAQNRAQKGIEEGAKIVYKNMQQSMMSFRDTGASMDEMQVSSISTSSGDIKVNIYWDGPKDRYRLIHLNEKGYTRDGKRYTPRGYGALARALRKSETVYFHRVRRELTR